MKMSGFIYAAFVISVIAIGLFAEEPAPSPNTAENAPPRSKSVTPLAATNPAGPSAAAEQIGEKIRAVVPGGWSVVALGDQVVVERVAPIQVYNGVSLPPRRPWGKKIPLSYRITLRLGERLTRDQYLRRKAANIPIEAKAVESLRPKELLSDYIAAHPECGYQPLPWLYTGQNSLYVERSLIGYFDFDSKTEEAECNYANGEIVGLFGCYEPYKPFSRQ